ncbi:Bacteriophage/Gene transfer agent portal protein [uncultured Caudovirales phage]|uniref:Bacteriophage/Gene transfer agent portal protein n=1 Tax=uncultured Caudovirales phage TaxID=2100421 RepID=A0A6J5KJQ9_9CAUD|nr:Bacteriophage/Gene transfer agent portal protein [uncultured Caudovirales phage]
MGVIQNLFGRDNAPVTAAKTEIKAQVNPAVYDAPYGQYWGNYGLGGYNNFATSIDRQNAMSVPAIAQCRNLIAGTAASIPLEIYSMSTGEEIQNQPMWVRQPDKRAPRAVTISWTVDSLLMYGVAYWRVTDVSADNRPLHFEWLQNDRVTLKLNKFNSEIDYYMVNGERVPDSGVGSLITFQHLDQGILLRGSRTIKAAADLELAAAIAAQTPQPSGFIKNNGADLPDDIIQGLLATWKQARLSKSTAYLTSTLDYTPTQFSPAEMMYNEAIQNMALQICRMMNVDATYLSAETMRSNTYSNILDKRKEFLAYTLQPYITAIEDRLSLDDITPRGQIVRFDVDETFLRANPLDRLAVTEKLLQLNLISLDQAKAMEDLTPEGNTDEA